MLYDTNPRAFNRELARELKERKLVTPPDWTPFVKTGSHRERVPQQPDWWYHRAASILRTVSIKGPIGTSKMAVLYGGRKNRGVAPDQFREAGTNIIRKCLQQLEKSKLVKQVTIQNHKGRIVTKEGAALLKGVAGRVSKDASTHVFKERVQKERVNAGASPATAPRPQAKPAPKGANA
jgi:small subunit ribosomal protein S19e